MSIMNKLLIILAVVSLFSFSSCDVQSGITKKSVEKFEPTPTPSPRPTDEPIDPADAVQVDKNLAGPMVSVNEAKPKKEPVCDKYNQVMVNADGAVFAIKGPCRNITVNGDNNDITAEAASEIVFYGSGNTVKYYRYANGERPVVTDSKKANTTEKVAAPAEKK